VLADLAASGERSPAVVGTHLLRQVRGACPGRGSPPPCPRSRRTAPKPQPACIGPPCSRLTTVFAGRSPLCPLRGRVRQGIVLPLVAPYPPYARLVIAWLLSPGAYRITGFEARVGLPRRRFIDRPRSRLTCTPPAQRTPRVVIRSSAVCRRADRGCCRRHRASIDVVIAGAVRHYCSVTEWPFPDSGGVPSPQIVAAWARLGLVRLEKVPWCSSGPPTRARYSIFLLPAVLHR
jgi:hypothetical protein